MPNWIYWGGLISLVSVILSAGVTVHAVLNKRDSRAVIGWVGLAWLAPFLGTCFYLVLGINRIHRKAKSLGLPDSAKMRPTLNANDLRQQQGFIDHHPNLVGLANAGKTLAGLPLSPGNSVEPMIDGDEAYPAMIAAIDHARESVSLLSYIFDCDRVGNQFLDALERAQDRGVKVRVLIDDVGSTYSKPNMVGRLKEKSIPVATFLPTPWARLPVHANMRNHRKILVVDGVTAFTGGTNIREGHSLNLDPSDPVQCLHFRLVGPVVTDLQSVFANDWAFATDEQLQGEEWFPQVERSGDVWARGVEHGPDEHFERLADLIAAALASARTRVRILTPYFLPNASLIQALSVTAMRGVAVEIYIPAENNIALVQWACSAQLSQVLDKGCRVFYTSPPFDHTKLMMVDDVWSLIGSTNWDPRSLRLNFEFNVECYSTELAVKLNQIMDRKAKSASEITLEQLASRSLPVRLRDGLARLLSPYL